MHAKTLAGDGDSEPAYIKMHTNPAGAAINIVPFPKRRPGLAKRAVLNFR